MKKLFVMSVGDSGITVIPKRMQRAMQMRRGDIFYLYKIDESKYFLTEEVQEQELICPVQVSGGGIRNMIRLPQKVTEALSWRKEIFAHIYDERIELIRAKPHCFSCKRVFPLDELENMHDIFYCRECLKKIEEVSVKDIRDLEKEYINLNEYDRLSLAEGISGAEAIEYLIETNSLIGSLMERLEKFAIKLEEEYGVSKDDIDIAHIYTESLMREIGTSFYLWDVEQNLK